MDGLDRADHPNNRQVGVIFFLELFAEGLQYRRIMDFFGKRGVDQNDIVVFEGIERHVQNDLVFDVAEVFSKKGPSRSFGSLATLKATFDKRHQGVFIEIDDVLEVLRQLHADVGFAAGGGAETRMSFFSMGIFDRVLVVIFPKKSARKGT
jgi:hypothetical protein